MLRKANFPTECLNTLKTDVNEKVTSLKSARKLTATVHSSKCVFLCNKPVGFEEKSSSMLRKANFPTECPNTLKTNVNEKVTSLKFVQNVLLGTCDYCELMSGQGFI